MYQFIKKYFFYTRASWAALVVWSVVAGATCVLGMRVVRTKWFYSGNFEENYFAGLGPLDGVWFCGLTLGILAITVLLVALYHFLLDSFPARKTPLNPAVVFCVSWLVIFLCWVPYYLANYPCSLYADSIVIIRQAIGMNALSNHHPIFYVGLVGAFLEIGKTFFDSYIMGIAFYTAFQMAFISGMLAYLLAWMAKRRVPFLVLVVLCVLFSVLSIFPLHAVSMWKDGLYAVFVLRIVLLLFDVVAQRGAPLDRPFFLVRFVLWGLLVCLVRSNGIFVMALVWAFVLLLFSVREREQRGRHALPNLVYEGPLARLRGGIVLAALACFGGYALVVGPLSSALDVKTEPVESYGILLQQTAAVVVYDGQLNTEQKEMLNTLLPLEEYKEEYVPCSVDGIKWADNFNTEYFDSHQVEYVRTWFEVGLQNPGIYAKAFIMESYEYWSFADVQRTFTLNGVNDKYDAVDLGIIETNLLDVWFGERISNVFAFKFAHLQEGAASWIVLFMGLLLYIARKERWSFSWAGSEVPPAARVAPRCHAGLGTQQEIQPTPFKAAWWLVLVPLVANWLSVIITSPFAALPRYILPTYFMLPWVVVLPWMVCTCAQVHLSGKNVR